MGELSSTPVRGAVVRLRALWVAVVTISACVSAGAATYYEEQGQLVRAGRSVTALGPDLFGDKVSLYSGASEFVQTDVSLPDSDALHMAVTRRLSSCVAAKEVSGLFGRWDFDLPRVQGSVLQRGITQC